MVKGLRIYSKPSWRPWKLFQEEIHCWEKWLLWMCSTGNSRTYFKRLCSTSYEAQLLEESFFGAWSQDFSWYQEGSWNGIQVLRLVTATSLLIVCLIRAACWGFTECQSLISIYWVLCLSAFPQHMEFSIEDLAPLNVETCYTLWERYLVSLIEINVRAICLFYILLLFLFLLISR
jgi:hypothetical protein